MYVGSRHREILALIAILESNEAGASVQGMTPASSTQGG